MRDLSVKPFHGVVKEYDHWIVLFREKQVTLGSVIIMSKQLDCQSLGAVSPEAWSQFGEVCGDVERALVNTFGAEKFNYLALMMIDPEVHFHVIPRYASPVFFEGQEFIDTDWPEATRRVALSLTDEMKNAIEQQIHHAMHK